MTNTSSSIAIALVCVAGLGCTKPGDAGPAGAAGEPSASSADDVLDLYVECFNEVDHRVHDSWESYAQWVDIEKGVTGKEPSVDGIRSIDDYHTGKCLKQLAQADANGAGSLAGPTKAYSSTLSALLPIVVTARTYYDHKDYKDDGFAKGKQLHVQLVAAFEAWAKADDAMRAGWETRHRAQRDAHLASVEKDKGRKSELFVTAQVMNVAESLVDALHADGKPDAELAAITAYQAAYAEMDAFFGPGLTASTDTDRYMFKQSADAVLVQTKEAARALKAGKPLPASGDGSPTQLMAKYNDLVERSNSITWD